MECRRGVGCPRARRWRKSGPTGLNGKGEEGVMTKVLGYRRLPTANREARHGGRSRLGESVARANGERKGCWMCLREHEGGHGFMGLCRRAKAMGGALVLAVGGGANGELMRKAKWDANQGSSANQGGEARTVGVAAKWLRR